MSEPREVALIADGARLLAEARDLFEVQQVVGLAKAAVAYAHAKDLGEDAIRSANRIVILATLRLGQEIAAGKERGSIASRGLPPSQMDIEGGDIPATLSDLGISPDLSATAQRFARNMQSIVDYAHRAESPSQAGALRAINQEAETELIRATETEEDRHRELVAAIERHLTNALLATEQVPDLSKEERKRLTGQAGYLMRRLKGTYDDEAFDAPGTHPQPRLVG